MRQVGPAIRILLLLPAVLLSWACRTAPSGPAGDSPERPAARRLENSFPSAEALGEEVLRALRERDAQALEALRITEREYKEILFPEFPAAQPGRTIPVDFHWSHLDIRSRAGVRAALSDHGGQVYRLLEVVATGGVEEYRTFKLLRKVALKVKLADGSEALLRFLGHVVVLDGQYKVLGFPT